MTVLKRLASNIVVTLGLLLAGLNNVNPVVNTDQFTQTRELLLKKVSGSSCSLYLEKLGVDMYCLNFMVRNFSYQDPRKFTLYESGCFFGMASENNHNLYLWSKLAYGNSIRLTAGAFREDTRLNVYVFDTSYVKWSEILHELLHNYFMEDDFMLAERVDVTVGFNTNPISDRLRKECK